MMFLLLQDTTMFDESILYDQDIYVKKMTKRALPESFTYAQESCINNSIMNQGSCGNCWAVAEVMAQTMRRCLKGDPEWLSIEEHTGCDHINAYGVTNSGCKGGSPVTANMYSAQTGDVYESCYSYKEMSITYPYKDVACQATCDDGTPKKRLMSKNAHRILGEQNIMEEIMNNGPVAASIYLYSGFPPYDKEEPFEVLSTSRRSGGHAIVILGWGIHNGVKYWDIANTYGKLWNDDGKARIRRGENDMMIESYVSAAEVIVSESDSSNTNESITPSPEKGSFTFVDNWVIGKTATLKYEYLNNCTLTIDDKSVATISGAGSINIFVDETAGLHTLKCGETIGKFTAVSFQPSLSSSAGTVEEGKSITLTTVYNSNVEEYITYGGSNYTVTSSTKTVTAVFGVSSAAVETSNTNPIVKASTSFTVTAAPQADDGTILEFVTAPNDQYDVGATIAIKMKQQFIFTVRAQLVDEQGVAIETVNWENPDNIKYLSEFSMSLKASKEGKYKIFLLTDTGKKVYSSEFVIGSLVKECEIVSSVSNIQVLKDTQFSINTTNCVGSEITFNGTSLGQVNSNEEFIELSQTGTGTLKINSTSIEITVLEPMQMIEEEYSAYLGDIVVIEVTNLPAKYTVITAGTYTVEDSTFAVKFADAGTFTFAVKTEGLVTDYSVQATIIVKGRCIMSFDVSKTYFVGQTLAFAEKYCEGNFKATLPDNSAKEFESSFVPTLVGQYTVQIGDEKVQFEVKGINVELKTQDIEELSTKVELSFQTASTTSLVALEMQCEDRVMNTVLLVTKERSVEFYIPNTPCNSIKFRMYEIENQAVYGETDYFIVKQYEGF